MTTVNTRIKATQPIAIVYHIDSEIPVLIIKSDEPTPLKPEEHYNNHPDYTHLFIHHDIYENFKEGELYGSYLKKAIPRHKSTLKR